MEVIMPEWTQDYPTEEGVYWVYFMWKGASAPAMAVADAHRTGNGTMLLVGMGTFLYRSEMQYMYFQKCIPPEPPEVKP